MGCPLEVGHNGALGENDASSVYCYCNVPSKNFLHSKFSNIDSLIFRTEVLRSNLQTR